MDRQQIGTALVIKALGLDFNMDAFGGRLILQKAIYLAQAAGIHLGYQYNWYLRGPYSPALAEDGFAIAAEPEGVEGFAKGWQLGEVPLEKVKRLCSLFEPSSSGNTARRLELLASVHFLVANARTTEKGAAEIAETLKRYRKQYSPSEVQDALEALREHGLI